MSLILAVFITVESIFLVVRVSSYVCITFTNDPSKEGLGGVKRNLRPKRASRDEVSLPQNRGHL